MVYYVTSRTLEIILLVYESERLKIFGNNDWCVILFKKIELNKIILWF